MKRSIRTKLLSIAMTMAVAIGSLSAAEIMMGPSVSVSAAKKAKLKTKSLKITKGSKKSIVIKNKNKKRTYTFTVKKQKKKVATVTKKGVVKGIRVGKTTITVKEKYKKGKKTKTVTLGKVKVNVVKKSVKKTPEPVAQVTPPPTNDVVPTAAPVVGTGADFYVSTTGNDANPGTKELPFLTLEKAKQAVRGLGKTKDIVVEITDGFYPVTNTINFTSEDSGNDNCTITYRAAEGACPIISGGHKVTGNWVEADDVDWLEGGLKAYKIPLSRDKKLRALYVNGNRASMTSRVIKPAGKSGSYSVQKGEADWAWNSRGGLADTTIFPSSCELSADTRNPRNIEIDSSSTWARQIVCVDYLSENGDGIQAELQMPYAAFAQNLGWGTAYSADTNNTVTNVFEWLSKPGEFYFDQEGSMLYYIPLEDEDINTAEVITPEVDTLIEMRGNDPTKSYVQNIVFDGITFAYSDWNLVEVDDSYGYASVQGSIVLTAFGQEDQHNDIYRTYDVPAAAILLNSSRNIKFINGEIRHTGNLGIHIENDVNDIDVIGNYIGKTNGS